MFAIAVTVSTVARSLGHRLGVVGRERAEGRIHALLGAGQVGLQALVGDVGRQLHSSELTAPVLVLRTFWLVAAAEQPARGEQWVARRAPAIRACGG